ncbi:caspase domain-containing protein [Streptomyces sp. NPDC056061]|uniref:caspase family protein n=1 Tax=Streptomyces sp. NPDC056061 TaxID=3345700 RepID=UPI0035DDA692
MTSDPVVVPEGLAVRGGPAVLEGLAVLGGPEMPGAPAVPGVGAVVPGFRPDPVVVREPLVVPDRMNTRLVLVGSSTFTRGLSPLPAAAADVRDLAGALTGPDGLFDPSALATFVDPVEPGLVLDRLHSYADLATPLDLLLFYYAGHGVSAEDNRLCLALPGTVDVPKAAGRTSLPAEDVFAALRGARARHRVVVLDCCYAGRALDAPSAADLHLLLASDRISRALTNPSGEGNTAFTTELLLLLRAGDPEGARHLGLDTLFRRLVEALPGRDPLGPPRPLQRTVNLSGDLALAVNPAYGTGRTAPGLARRARLADRVGRAGHPARAGMLFGRIAGDAAQVLPPGRECFRYERAHAAWTGASGDAAGAAALLDGIVPRMESVLPGDDEDLRDARTSLAHWRTAADAAERV